MADIAELGFKVNTADLEKGRKSLDAISAAAAGVSTSAKKMESIIEGASSSIAQAAALAARAENQRAAATLKTLRASGTATAEEIRAARAIQQKTAAAAADAQAEAGRLKALQAIARANRDVASTAKAAAAAQGSVAASNPGSRVSGVVNGGRVGIARDQLPNRFNTGNIAAQFQDIGVTAAMGMNPLTIALQQGTQISAVLQTMESPLRGIAIAFRQIINPVSLMAIGFVGLVAALIQFVNWTKVAKTVMNALADAIEVATPYVVALALAMTLLYSRSIIVGLYTLITTYGLLGIAALKTGAMMAAAWLIGLGPVAWIIAGVISVAVAFQAMGVNVVGMMRDAANGIIGAFVGAFNSIKAVWGILPSVMADIVFQSANFILKGISDLINGAIDLINGLVDALPAALKKRVIGEGGAITFRANLQLDNPYAGEAAAAGKIAANEFKKAFETDYVGKGIKIARNAGAGLANSIRGAAKGIGGTGIGTGDGKDKKGGKTEAERYDDIVRAAERRIAALETEKRAIGQTEAQTNKLKYMTELLNDAQEKKINLDVKDVATGQTRLQQLDALAQKMADLKTQTDRNKDAFEFLKDSSKGFFNDLKTSLSEGKSLWESFGIAVTNILNKIADKLFDSAINRLFEGSSGGADKILSSISSFLFNAKGNAFGSQGVQAFAKGGSFTNSIVDRTTPFTFANGGKFGVMGEAGPEAVMPLHRGPDGSLGVKMAGANDNSSGGSVVVNVNNYGNSTAKVEQRQTGGGIEIDVIIDEAFAKNALTRGSKTSQALQAVSSQSTVRR